MSGARKLPAPACGAYFLVSHHARRQATPLSNIGLQTRRRLPWLARSPARRQPAFSLLEAGLGQSACPAGRGVIATTPISWPVLFTGWGRTPGWPGNAGPCGI